MFVVMMPLLAGRTVIITVAPEDDKTLRMNVIPTIKSGDGENRALTMPLSSTGTPEEIDAELGRELAGSNPSEDPWYSEEGLVPRVPGSPLESESSPTSLLRRGYLSLSTSGQGGPGRVRTLDLMTASSFTGVAGNEDTALSSAKSGKIRNPGAIRDPSPVPPPDPGGEEGGKA